MNRSSLSQYVLLALMAPAIHGLSCSLIAPSDELLSRDPPHLHCAAGERVCGGVCRSVDVQCGVEDDRYRDCNGDASDGAEIDTRSDPMHCGACTTSCSTEQMCELGRCTARCHAIRPTSFGAWIRIPSKGFDVGLGDFTFETWVRKLSNSRYGMLFSSSQSEYGHSFSLTEGTDSTTKQPTLRLEIYGGTTAHLNESTEFYFDVSVDEWHHIALTRASGVAIAHVDGQEIGRHPATARLDALDEALLGRNPHAPRNSVMDAVIGPTRISRVARYVADFTPSRTWEGDDSTIALWLTTRGLEARSFDTADGPVERDVLVDEGGTRDGFANDGVVMSGWVDATALGPCAQ